MSTRAYIAAQLLNAGFFAISGGLTTICLCNLVAGHKVPEQPWSRGRAALLVYVAIMGGLSLVAIVSDSLRFVAFVQYLTDVLYHGANNTIIRYFEDDMLRVVLPLTVWATESFMMWRLYEHTRPVEKRGAFMLGCLTAVLIGLSIASSIPLLLYRPRTHQYGEFLFAYRFFSFVTALVNVSISLTIAARLIFWDRVFDGVEHKWGPYGRVILRILVAAGAPLTLCAVLSASFFKVWVHDFMVIPIFVMPQISAISALLIVYGISNQDPTDEGVIRLEDTLVPEDDAPANA